MLSEYTGELFKEVVQTVIAADEDSILVSEVALPPPLCSSFEKPNKDVALAEHVSRFPRDNKDLSDGDSDATIID